MADVLKGTLRPDSGESHTLTTLSGSMSDGQGTGATLSDGNDSTGSFITATVGGGTSAEGNYREEWNLGALSYSGPISFIKLIARVKGVFADGGDTGTASYRPSIAGVNRGVEHTISSVTNDSQTFATDPADSAAWTSGKLNGQQFGWLLYSRNGSDFPSPGDTATGYVVDFKVEVWGPDVVSLTPSAVTAATAIIAPTIVMGAVALTLSALSCSMAVNAPSLNQVMHPDTVVAQDFPTDSESMTWALPPMTTNHIQYMGVTSMASGVVAPSYVGLGVIPQTASFQLSPVAITDPANVYTREYLGPVVTTVTPTVVHATSPGSLGDDNLTTRVASGTISAGPGTFTVVASTMEDVSSSHAIDHVVFFVTGGHNRLIFDSGPFTAPTDTRLSWTVSGQTSTVSGLADFSGYSAYQFDGSTNSGAVFVQPNGAPWTWDAVNALVNVTFAQDYPVLTTETFPGSGILVPKYYQASVAEIFVEVFGVENQPPNGSHIPISIDGPGPITVSGLVSGYHGVSLNVGKNQ